MPTALLVRRALLGMEAERAGRQRAVAERVFDEMERALSAWLAAEEARPPEAWSFYLEPGVRSPLSLPRGAAADRPAFVLGGFVADAQGLHSPLRPRAGEEALARRRGELPAPAAQAEAEAVLAVARRALAADGERAASAGQAPGTTLALAPGRAASDAEASGEAAPEAYGVLQSLNRGAQLREERAVRTARLADRAEPGAGTTRTGAPPPAAEPEVPPGRAGAEAAAPASRRDAPTGPATSKAARSEEEVAPARRQDLGPGHGERALRPPATRLVDPFHGRRVDDAHLVLVRTVVVEGAASRQGLVLDAARLGAFLEREVLAAPALREARAAFRPADAPPPAPGAAPAYRHRFAEPFDGLAADLVLPPLAGGGDAGTVWALAGLLALAGVAGLVAVERMVAVAVAFAERRSRFVAAVSHELKTPLTAIRLHGEMLRDGMLPDDAKRAAAYATITAEAERLSRLIGNVLELSRLERDDRPVETVAGPVAPVLEELAESLRPHLAREGFALELDVDPALPAARFDRDALLQVLFNLVDNAVKYAREGTERRIRLEARPAPRGGVALAVRDFGPGVAGRELARVFEPFHRGEGGRVRRTAGTGIGLALVRGLVERMGGAVEGRNPPGGGFEVRLRLPAA